MLILLLLLVVVVSWIVLYVAIIRPHLAAFRLTAGLYARLDARETTLRARIALRLRGLKVAIAGMVTTAIPLVPVIYEQASGLDWAAIFPDERAKTIAFVFAAAGIVGPMVLTAAHSIGLAKAAAITPATIAPAATDA